MPNLSLAIERYISDKVTSKPQASSLQEPQAQLPRETHSIPPANRRFYGKVPMRCPNCGSPVVPEGGCWTCPRCGTSGCGD